MGTRKVADMYGDAVQRVLNEIHEMWQSENISMQAIFSELPDFKRFLFAMAKLNYQVENGGFSQWIYNQYADDTGEALMQYLDQITQGTHGDMFPTLAKVRQALVDVADALEESGDGGFEWAQASTILEKSSDSDGDVDNLVDRSIEERDCELASILENLNDDIDNCDILILEDHIDVDNIRAWRTDKMAYGPIELTINETSYGRLDELEEALNDAKRDEVVRMDEGAPERNDRLTEIEAALDIVERLFDLEPTLADLERRLGKEDEETNLGARLDLLDSLYYKIDENELWKEVAHAAEVLDVLREPVS